MNTTEAYRLGYSKAFDDLAERFADLGTRHTALGEREADIETLQALIDARLTELRAAWVEEVRATYKPLPRPSREEIVAGRIAEMEAHAARSGRPEYHGGPVDWETGRSAATTPRLAVAA